MPALGCLWACCHLQQIEKESVSSLSPSVFAEACGGGGREEQKHLLEGGMHLGGLERPFPGCARKARHGCSLEPPSFNF